MTVVDSIKNVKDAWQWFRFGEGGQVWTPGRFLTPQFKNRPTCNFSSGLDEEDKGGYGSKMDVIGCEKYMRRRD